MATRADSIAVSGTADYSIWRVILAASVGTMFEWYDFYIFGSLAAVLSTKFYPPGNPTFAFIAYLSTITVILLQFYMTPANFQSYGWRIPFLISVILVMISLYIRLKMKESPIFTQIKSTGMSSAKPLMEAFTQWPNFRLFLVSLLGATAGQGVVWYTGQYYALFYLQSILKVNLRTSFIIVALALLFAMPFFTVFGALSDKIGRKKIIMAGCLLAVVTYYPIYHAMRDAAGNNVVTFKSQRNPVTGAPTLTPLTVEASGQQVPAPVAPNPNVPLLTFLAFIQVIYVTMVYGPIAAYLVEAYPAKIRYSAFSFPYHIGNGVFGGLAPLGGVYLSEPTANIYADLVHTNTVAAGTFVVGSIFLKEPPGRKIGDEVGGRPAAATR